MVIDTMRNKERMYQLNFAEFLYFLCRVSEVHYLNTDYENEEYWIKLDKMLLYLLAPFELRPTFRFNAKFAFDCQQNANKVTNTEYLEEEIPEEDQDSNPFKESSATAHMMQKVESTRYSQIEDDMNEEDSKVEEESKIMHVDTLMQDGDIQAWPQPSPIAYPQRKEIITSPENSMQQHESD